MKIPHPPALHPYGRIACRLADEEFALSLQVVQEFINTCLNKVRLGQSRKAIAETVELLLAYPWLGSSHGLIRHAFRGR